MVPDEFKYLYVQNEERPVVKIPAPVLRQVAAEVPKISKKIDKLIEDMMRIMKLANGVGIAAPQVGVRVRVIIIAPEGMKPTALINPKILKAESTITAEEGCLSIPGLYGDVTRPGYVEVEALDQKGKLRTYKLEGYGSSVVQHEIDHLDGVLFIDKVNLATLHWVHPAKPNTGEDL